jgi:hypothetical protein
VNQELSEALLRIIPNCVLTLVICSVSDFLAARSWFTEVSYARTAHTTLWVGVGVLSFANFMWYIYMTYRRSLQE